MRFLVLFSCAGIVWGQVTAQMHGTVQDTSGAAVAGAQVNAIQTNTGTSRSIVSGSDGSFVLTNLPLGPYRIEVAKEGFTKSVQSGIVLEVGSDPGIPIALNIGTVNEQILVEASASQVETRSLGVGTVVETSERIVDLPLNGRQPTDLITLGGAAAVTQNAFFSNLLNTGAQISVAGSNGYSVQYSLDGASHLDTYQGSAIPLPFPDALQEFRLTTGTQDASGGGHSGGAVNAVTKSGSNSFHGDLFEFFRNGDLNARNFFAADNDHLKRNQFGGVLGGPIMKNKLFFFLGYQGTAIRQTPSSTISYVPTAAMAKGDFSAYIANRCPEASRISPALLSSTGQLLKPISAPAAAVAAALPTPINACGQVYTGRPLHQNQMQVPTRIDYQINSKQSLFARYLISRNVIVDPYELAPNDILTTGGGGANDQAQSLAVGHTYVINPTLVNTVRVFGNRMGQSVTYKPELDPTKIGVRNFYTSLPNLLDIFVLSDFSIGFPIQLVGDYYSNFGFSDDVNLVRGSHQFSFGGLAMRTGLVSYDSFWVPGIFTFGGLPVVAGGTGSPLVDFLTGTVTNLHQYSQSPINYRQNQVSLYVSDTWKIRPRLTMNYGLRWNPYLPLQWTDGTVENFSLSKFYANEHSSVLPSAPVGFTFPGDPGFQGKAGVERSWKLFEPRIGLAFDPVGDGKTVLRVNGGISRDFIYAFPFANTDAVAPFVIGVNLNGPLNFSDPWSTIPGGNPFPYNYNKKAAFPTFPQYQGFYPFNQHLPETQQQSWSFALQRQIKPSLFASATYLGTHLIHTWDSLELNPAIYIPGNCAAGQYGLTAPGPCSTLANENQRRLLQLTNPAGAGTILGSMDSIDTSGTQTYNGLLLSVNYRKGPTSLSANYTWSHCYGLPFMGIMNNGSSYHHAPYQNNGPQNRYLDYGDCNTSAIDVRHIANVTLVAATPRFSGAVSRKLLSSWHFGTIFSIRTGYPVTASTGADTALNGLFVPQGGYNYVLRPNQVLSDTAAANQGQSCSFAPCVSWLNPRAFGQPTPGTYGNMGVGTLRAPGFWEWDQSVYRDFRVREGQTVQVRGEAFNVTNSLRLGTPNVNVSSALFGTILSANPGRVIQFAIKYVF